RRHSGPRKPVQISGDELRVGTEEQIVARPPLPVAGPAFRELRENRGRLAILSEKAENGGQGREGPSRGVGMSASLAHEKLRTLEFAERHVGDGAGMVERPQVRVARAEVARRLEQRNGFFGPAAPHEREGKGEIALREAWVYRD